MSGLQLNRELANLINQSRPQCVDFSVGRCKKGHKCKFRHCKNAEMLELPRMAAQRDENGLIKLNIMPPVKEALGMYYKFKECPATTVGNGERLSDEVYKFEIPYMRKPDMHACSEARRTGQVETPDRKITKLGRECPKVLMHGTSVKNALDIIADRAIDPSEGVHPCGNGIYTLECDSFEAEDMLKTYERLAAGGYNNGACFVLEPKGMLARCKPNETVPPGVISLRTSLKVLAPVFMRPVLC